MQLLKENLLLANPDASDNEIWNALEIASAKEFVQALPSQENTMIGERGIRLSMGEKQRHNSSSGTVKKSTNSCFGRSNCQR